jgi:hypothetical protein
MSATLEQDFMKAIMVAIGSRPWMRVWRQNTGSVEVVKKGKPVGVFHAGPPKGASDISGIVGSLVPNDPVSGFRLEIETKAESTSDLPHQAAWKQMISDLGGVAVKVRYNEGLTMKENVSCAVACIDNAIVERRKRGVK